MVNIHQAKTHLSQLVEQAAAGEEVVIARAGRPVARLVAYNAPQTRGLRFGLFRGQIEMAEDFRDIPADLAEAFDAT